MLARYALAAEKQGAYWDMASAIYDNLPFNEDAVLNLADKIGINKEQLKKDAYGEDVISDLDKQIQKAINFGIIDDIEHRSALPYPKLKELVKQARARHRHDK